MYFITAMCKLEMGNFGWFKTGGDRCFGYYAKKDDAFYSVINNELDINETIYDYAVIEKIDEGIHRACREDRWFFKFDYDKGKYYQIEEPECVHGIINFALG